MSEMKLALNFLIMLLLLLMQAACRQKHGGCCYDNRELEKTENKTHYTIKAGETFRLMRYENPSTGSSNCWLNEERMRSVSLQGAQYYQDGSEDCVGCGGTIVYTFKGERKGVDSIKMADCPTGIEQKNCSSFSEDSVSVSLFIVNVE